MNKAENKNFADQIIDSSWFSQMQTESFIGVVLVEYDNGEYYKAFMGIINQTQGEDVDKLYIRKWGSKLNPRIAHGFFPHIPKDKFNF